jgi:hypothetical protein
MGFGLYFLVPPHPRLGLVLCVFGFFSIYPVMFRLLPYLRGFRPHWSLHIGPFEALEGYLLYIFRIYAPFGFLPFMRWRFGIMPFPFIGAYLLFGSYQSSVYSMSAPSAGVFSCLLFISMVLIFQAMFGE